MLKAWLKKHVSDKNLTRIKRVHKRVNSIPTDLLYWVSERLQKKNISFIIVGAQKSGTTALHSFLQQHPDISMSLIKETNFFSLNYNADYKVYHRYFEPFPRGKILGEASGSYMLEHEVVAPRIKEYNPDIKLIFILKNPIERTYSQYKMHQTNYGLDLSFEQCLEIAKKKEGKNIILELKSGFSTNTIESYLTFGHYCCQIKSFQNNFPPQQLLFIRTEDLLESHSETMQRILSFLQARPISIPHEIIHSNKGAGMSRIARSILEEEFDEEINELENMLNWDLSHWK